MKPSTPLRSLLHAGESVLDRLLCVFGALVFTQFPEFIQQYLQRLGGRLDEARRQLAEFESVARQSQLTLAQFIERTSGNVDTAVASLGTVMQNTVLRVDELSAADAAIRNATLWGKPWAFLAHLDYAMAEATLEIYRPAIPTTLEGVVYGVVGMVALLSLYHGLIRYPIVAASRRSALKKNTPATT